MQRDPLGFYTRTWQTHGDYVRLRIVRGIDGYLLTHPDAVEHVLHKGHRNYRKPDVFYNTVGLLVGDGLFTNEGQSWANQRKAVQPAQQILRDDAVKRADQPKVSATEQIVTVHHRGRHHFIACSKAARAWPSCCSACETCARACATC